MVSLSFSRTNGRNHSQHTTESVDCWAVGVLAYEFLVGHTPFRPPPASSPLSSSKGGHSKHAPASPYAADTEQNRLYKSILRGVIRFPPHVSPDAQEFITRLLHSDPRKRMRLRDALNHPWIRQHATAATVAAVAAAGNAAAAAAAGTAPRE